MTVLFFPHPSNQLTRDDHDAKYQISVIIFENHTVYHKKVKFKGSYLFIYLYI
jgi:hypothetical protein